LSCDILSAPDIVLPNLRPRSCSKFLFHSYDADCVLCFCSEDLEAIEEQLDRILGESDHIEELLNDKFKITGGGRFLLLQVFHDHSYLFYFISQLIC
jgi:hypothetical protein